MMRIQKILLLLCVLNLATVLPVQAGKDSKVDASLKEKGTMNFKQYESGDGTKARPFDLDPVLDSGLGFNGAPGEGSSGGGEGPGDGGFPGDEGPGDDGPPGGDFPPGDDFPGEGGPE